MRSTIAIIFALSCVFGLSCVTAENRETLRVLKEIEGMKCQCSNASSQNRGCICGYVMDEHLTKLESVPVSLSAFRSNLTLVTITDKKGYYFFSQLPAGVGYELMFETPGYSKVVRKGITVKESETTVVNVTLPGAMLEGPA